METFNRHQILRHLSCLSVCSNQDCVRMQRSTDFKLCTEACISHTPVAIYNRLYLDTHYSTIDREQASFRPGSSCVDHINTLWILIQQSAEYRSALHLVFVDFEKAFDSVDGERLWMALRRRGIANKLVSVIKSIYNCEGPH